MTENFQLDSLFGSKASNVWPFWKAATSVQSNFVEALIDRQREYLGFLDHRYDEATKLFDRLAKSGDMKQAYDTCTSFIQEGASEYRSQALKAVGLDRDWSARS